MLLRGSPTTGVRYAVLREQEPQLGDADVAGPAPADDRLAAAVADLASGRGGDAPSVLAGYAIRYVLAESPVSPALDRVLDSAPGLTQISAQVAASEAYIGSLTTRVNGLQERAQMFAPYNTRPGARRMPDDLAEEMVRAMSELRTQNLALASRRSEMETVTQQFDEDIKRFKELRMSAAARLSEANGIKKQ